MTVPFRFAPSLQLSALPTRTLSSRLVLHYTAAVAAISHGDNRRTVKVELSLEQSGNILRLRRGRG